MPAKRASGISVQAVRERSAYREHERAFGVITGNARLRSHMPARISSAGNHYLCAIEKNQSGKYDVRVRAVFSRDGWTLPVYFLASSFNAAMKKLEESLQLLQKNEEKLRFWGVERTDDPNLAGELLKELGLALDRRRELPRKVGEFIVARDKVVGSSSMAAVRRTLADSLAQEREAYQMAAAGD
jgi:hypothetical protein